MVPLALYPSIRNLFVASSPPFMHISRDSLLHQFHCTKPMYGTLLYIPLERPPPPPAPYQSVHYTSLHQDQTLQKGFGDFKVRRCLIVIFVCSDRYKSSLMLLFIIHRCSLLLSLSTLFFSFTSWHINLLIEVFIQLLWMKVRVRDYNNVLEHSKFAEV